MSNEKIISINQSISIIQDLRSQYDLTNEQNQALLLAVLALEKVKPKQPITSKNNPTVWLCPSCGVKIKNNNNYCHICGSRVEYDESLAND